MDGIALFTSQGLYFIFKWIHFLAGVAWIGLLWYINFVQGSFFAETDADTKKKRLNNWFQEFFGGFVGVRCSLSLAAGV